MFSMNRYFHFLFGIINFGQDCGCGVPSLVTRLSHYLPWLNKEMFGLDKNEQASKSGESMESVEKRDEPVEISVHMKSKKNTKNACMGVVVDNNAVLTTRDCSDLLR